MKEKDRLLEKISTQIGCMYISDLHQFDFLPHILYTVRKISIQEKFDVEEWNGAISYIVGEKCTFQSQEEVISYLQDRMIDNELEGSIIEG